MNKYKSIKMNTNHNIKDICEKKNENGSRERENIARKILIGSYSIFW